MYLHNPVAACSLQFVVFKLINLQMALFKLVKSMVLIYASFWKLFQQMNLNSEKATITVEISNMNEVICRHVKHCV